MPEFKRVKDQKIEAYLICEIGDTTYEIPFGFDRLISGSVLFWATENPPLVKGMCDQNTFMQELEEKAKVDEQAREAYKMVESYQHDLLLTAGMKPEYTTERVDLPPANRP